MKHLFNNLSEEEKNSILKQHKGGIKIMTENFSKLLNAKLGDVKPILEQANPQSDWKTPLKQFFNDITPNNPNVFTMKFENGNLNTYHQDHTMFGFEKGEKKYHHSGKWEIVNDYLYNLFSDNSEEGAFFKIKKGTTNWEIVFDSGDYNCIKKEKTLKDVKFSPDYTGQQQDSMMATYGVSPNDFTWFFYTGGMWKSIGRKDEENTGTWNCQNGSLEIRSKDGWLFKGGQWVKDETKDSSSQQPNTGTIQSTTEYKDPIGYVQLDDTDETVITSGKKIIGPGAQGPLVNWAQQKLAYYFKDTNPDLANAIGGNAECVTNSAKCDGKFGKNSVKATKEFQMANHLEKVDGRIGKETWPKLKEVK